VSHVRPLAALALAAAAVLSARTASAQAMTETGFHAGQNAIEAEIGSGSSALGLLHFMSPTGALAFRVGGHLDGLSVTVDNSNYVAEDEGTKYGGQLFVGLGLRHYRPIAHSVSVLHEFGVTANYSHLPRDDSRYYGGGIYGDLGGQYAFSSNLSVGVTTGIAATYLREKYSDIGHANYTAVGTDGTRATVSFYF